MNSDAAVSIRQLRKVYPSPPGGDGDVVAVRGLDLDIEKGAVYGLIGPNGAGKTTLLKVIATLLAPTYGTVTVSGYDCDTNREDVCQRIGFMPELFSLYEELKVWEYLEFFAAAYGVPKEKYGKTVDSVIELTDLGVRRNSFTGTLSKGMRQRLLLAKTLIHDPEVLILDEPTSGMDPQARIEFRNIVRTLGKMKKTIIISSHILSDLSVFCTSIGIMERGSLIVSGTIDEVRAALEMKAMVELHVLESDPTAVSILEEIPGVSDVRQQGDKIVFSFDGKVEAKVEILAALVRGGVKVTEYVEKTRDLEEIFLQVGANQVG